MWLISSKNQGKDHELASLIQWFKSKPVVFSKSTIFRHFSCNKDLQNFPNLDFAQWHFNNKLPALNLKPYCLLTMVTIRYYFDFPNSQKNLALLKAMQSNYRISYWQICWGCCKARFETFLWFILPLILGTSKNRSSNLVITNYIAN